MNEVRSFVQAIKDAIADKLYETTYSCSTEFWLDTDVVYGALTALSELFNDRYRTSQLDVIHVDDFLVRAMWMSGYYGRVGILEPHLSELDANIRALGRSKESFDEYLEILLRDAGYAGSTSSPADGRVEMGRSSPRGSSVAHPEHQFLVLEAASADWRVRLKDMKSVIAQRPNERSLGSKIANPTLFSRLCSVMADLREEHPVSQRSITDAAALTRLHYLIEQRQSGPNLPLQRFYTHTAQVRDAIARPEIRSFFQRESAVVNIPTETAARMELSPFTCSTEYMIVRAVFNALAVTSEAHDPKQDSLDGLSVGDVKLIELLGFARNVELLLTKSGSSDDIDKVLTSLDGMMIGKRSGAQLLHELRAAAIWESLWSKNQSLAKQRIDRVRARLKEQAADHSRRLSEEVLRLSPARYDRGVWTEVRDWGHVIAGVELMLGHLAKMHEWSGSKDCFEGFDPWLDCGLVLLVGRLRPFSSEACERIKGMVWANQGDRISRVAEFMESPLLDEGGERELVRVAVLAAFGARKLALQMVYKWMQERSNSWCKPEADVLRLLCDWDKHKPLAVKELKTLALGDPKRGIKPAAAAKGNTAWLSIAAASMFWEAHWEYQKDLSIEDRLTTHMSVWIDLIEAAANTCGDDEEANTVVGSMLCLAAGVASLGKEAFSRGETLYKRGSQRIQRTRRLMAWRLKGDLLCQEFQQGSESQHGYLPGWKEPVLRRIVESWERCQPGILSAFEADFIEISRAGLNAYRR